MHLLRRLLGLSLLCAVPAFSRSCVLSSELPFLPPCWFLLQISSCVETIFFRSLQSNLPKTLAGHLSAHFIVESSAFCARFCSRIREFRDKGAWSAPALKFSALSAPGDVLPLSSYCHCPWHSGPATISHKYLECPPFRPSL